MKRARLPAAAVRRVRPRTPLEVLDSVRADLGEHFEDYLVLVRRRDDIEFAWALSDKTWARGAALRLEDKLRE